MGTHPIFESDFDCLTERMNLGEIFGGADYEEIGSMSSYCSSGDTGYNSSNADSASDVETDSDNAFNSSSCDITDHEGATLGPWVRNMGSFTARKYQIAIDAITRRDFALLRLALQTLNRRDPAVMMTLVHFYYNNVPRNKLINYADEAKHFKQLDLTCRKLQKMMKHMKTNRKPNCPAEFTYTVLLRALNALVYCDGNSEDDLVYKLNGIGDKLATTKYTVQCKPRSNSSSSWQSRPNPFKDYITRLVTAINVVVSVITNEGVDRAIEDACEPLNSWTAFWSALDDMPNDEAKAILRDKELVKVADDEPFSRARKLCDNCKMNEAVLAMLDAIDGWTVQGGTHQQWRHLLACCEKEEFLTEWTRLGKYSVSVYFDHIITRISVNLELTMSIEKCTCNDCNTCLFNILIDILDLILEHENET